MGDVEVYGGDALAALAKRLRSEDKALKRDLTRSIRAAALPIGRRALTALASTAPGGELERLAKRQRVTVQVRSGRNARVRVQAGKKGSGLRSLESKGQVRHPVYAKGPRSRWTWVTQQVPSARGRWGETLEAARPAVQREIIEAMQDAARRMTRG